MGGGGRRADGQTGRRADGQTVRDSRDDNKQKVVRALTSADSS